MLQAYFSLRCGEYVGILRRPSTAFDQDLPVCIFLSEPKDFVSLYIGIRAVGLAKEHVYDVSVDPFKSLIRDIQANLTGTLDFCSSELFPVPSALSAGGFEIFGIVGKVQRNILIRPCCCP
jgi:hypothetical protein